MLRLCACAFEPVPSVWWEALVPPRVSTKHKSTGTQQGGAGFSTPLPGLVEPITKLEPGGAEGNGSISLFCQDNFSKGTVAVDREDPYGVRSPKFIWAPCHVMCTAVIGVSSKQTKINFGSNRKKPKQDLFRVCFGLFHETKN